MLFDSSWKIFKWIFKPKCRKTFFSSWHYKFSRNLQYANTSIYMSLIDAQCHDLIWNFPTPDFLLFFNVIKFNQNIEILRLKCRNQPINRLKINHMLISRYCFNKVYKVDFKYFLVKFSRRLFLDIVFIVLNSITIVYSIAKIYKWASTWMLKKKTLKAITSEQAIVFDAVGIIICAIICFSFFPMSSFSFRAWREFNLKTC